MSEDDKQQQYVCSWCNKLFASKHIILKTGQGNFHAICWNNYERDLHSKKEKIDQIFYKLLELSELIHMPGVSEAIRDFLDREER